MKEMSLLSITMNWAYGHAPHTGDTFAFVGFWRSRYGIIDESSGESGNAGVA